MFVINTRKVKSDSDNVILCNTLNGAIVCIERIVFDAIVCLTGNKLKGYFETFNNIETYKELVENGFLVEDTFNEKYEFIKLLKMQWENDNRIDVHFLPTTGCNFNCPYCYQDGIARTYFMTDDDVKIIVSKLEDYLDINRNISDIRVTLHGGEPTLNWKVVPYFLDSIDNMCKKRDKQLSVTIVTNAYLLTEEKAKLLSKYHWIRLQVTIDGLEETHNKRRKLKKYDEKGSFNTIINNLKYIILNNLIEKIDIRINYDQSNYSEIDSLLGFLHENFPSDKVSLSFGNIVQTVCNTNASGYIDEHIVRLDTFATNYLELYKKAFKLGFDVGEGFSYSALCVGKMKHAFVFSPDGKIYTCLSTVGREKLETGEWRNNDTSIKSNSLMKFDLYEECFSQECPLIPMCHCDCRFDSYIHYGDKNKVWCRRKILEDINEGILAIRYYEYL